MLRNDLAMSSRPSLLLPGTVGISQALDEARHALCSLLKMEPDPRHLERWLIGAYHDATSFCPRSAAALPTTETPQTILEAQRNTARIIQAAAEGAEALVELLPPIVSARAAHDRFGGRGFVPFDALGSSLFDKAVALVMADYLTRPDDFLAHGFSTSAAPLRRISGTIMRQALSAPVGKTDEGGSSA